ncbi:MAG: hybrid sensor histidine kinase/response regulator, partial [Pricia sp.]
MKFQHIKRHGLRLALLLLFAVYMGTAQDTIPPKEVQTYFDAARIFSNKDQTDRALESLEKAAKVAEANADVKALVDSYQKTALVYLKLDREDTALIFSDRAKALLKATEYPYGDAVDKYIEALLAFRSGRNFQAIFMLNEARQLNNDRNFFNNILLAEGNIYLELGKFEEASKNFNSLIINTDLYESEYLATKAYLGLARLGVKTEEIEEGAVQAENALKLAKENDFFKEIIEANKLLTDVYSTLGRFGQALENNRNLLRIRDSIFNIAKVQTEAKTAEKIQFAFMGDEIK